MLASETATSSPSKEVDEQLASADADVKVAAESDLSRAGRISAASKKEQAEITTLVNMWEEDTLDKRLTQKTRLEYKGKRLTWRLDNHKNSAVNIDGHFYYVFAVQTGSNVYSNVQVPYLFYLGRQCIRDAFIKSMNELVTVRIALPERGKPQPPAQSDPAARKPNVADLQWQLVAVK